MDYKNYSKEKLIEEIENLKEGYESLNLKFYRVKKEKQVIRENIEDYKTLFENLPDAQVVISNRKLVFFNSKLQELTGYNRKELKGMGFEQIIHEDDREVLIKTHMNRFLNVDVPEKYSFRIYTKSGAIKEVEVHGKMIRWQGEPAVLARLKEKN